MPTAINPNVHFDYVLKCDRTLKAEEQTVWELRVLDLTELAQIEDGVVGWNPGEKGDKSDQGDITIRTGSQAVRILKKGLCGVRNFFGDDGEPVEFEVDEKAQRKRHVLEASDDFLNHLHPDWRRELGNAITEQRRLTEDQRGNLSSPQQSSAAKSPKTVDAAVDPVT